MHVPVGAIADDQRDAARRRLRRPLRGERRQTFARVASSGRRGIDLVEWRQGKAGRPIVGAGLRRIAALFEQPSPSRIGAEGARHWRNAPADE
jgi:hypothetical protein